MNDLISRKYLYDKITELEADVRKKLIATPRDSESYIRYVERLNERSVFKQEIMAATGFEVRPVIYGEWKQKTDYDANNNAIFECTNCFHGDVHAKGLEVSFCWFCGADMRKKV